MNSVSQVDTIMHLDGFDDRRRSTGRELEFFPPSTHECLDTIERHNKLQIREAKRVESRLSFDE